MDAVERVRGELWRKDATGEWRVFAVKDGFYDYSGRNARLVFPKSTWDGPAGTRFCYVLDMTTEQGERRSWSMTMRNPKPVSNGHNRLYTMPGKQGSMRYVAELKKSYANYGYYLLFREGPAGRIRFDKVRVEKLGVGVKSPTAGL